MRKLITLWYKRKLKKLEHRRLCVQKASTGTYYILRKRRRGHSGYTDVLRVSNHPKKNRHKNARVPTKCTVWEHKRFLWLYISARKEYGII